MENGQAPDFKRGALAGIAGGLIASYAMNRFQAAMQKTHPQQEDSAFTDDEAATSKMANAVAEKVLERPLTKQEKAPAGNAVHYLFGAAVGGVYGAVAESAPASRLGFGTLFGSILWFLADEIAVPRLGLSKPPQAYPASTHLSAWASHLVYGITTDLVRRGLRAV